MAPAVWFTSDTHFGHAKIIESCQRPFASVDEMDAVLIERWNQRVQKGDLVYHLGDFSWPKPERYVSRLQGRIHLLFGNHDAGRRNQLAALVEWCGDVKDITVDGRHVWLSHYAHRVWPRSHRGALHLFGHSHGNLPPTPASIDVGVDVWEYRPVSLEEIYERLPESEAPPR